MLTAGDSASTPDSCCAISSGPKPSGFRISVVTPCLSMFAAVESADSSAWLWMLMNPGATTSPDASITVGAVSRDRSPILAMRSGGHVGEADVAGDVRGEVAVAHELLGVHGGDHDAVRLLEAG